MTKYFSFFASECSPEIGTMASRRLLPYKNPSLRKNPSIYYRLQAADVFYQSDAAFINPDLI